MAIVYRRPIAQEMAEVAAVSVAAFNALNRRHGFAEIQGVPPNPFFAFSLEEESEGFWVAEDAGRIVGFAISWVCGSLWFLAYLFISPESQGRQIGRNLIARTLEHGDASTIRNRALITFAYNPVSIALYSRYGLYPREPLYAMRGPAAAAQATPEQGGSLVCEKLVPDAESPARLSHIDEQILGHRRDRHHRYLLNAQGASCYLLRQADTLGGYAYIWASGRVGPLAVLSPSVFGTAMNAALALAATQDGQTISVLIAGSNELAFSIATEHQMQIDYPLLFMSSKPLGNWAGYLFHSPWLM